MKHLKAKLMMSVMSLVLATIMMTTVSFAWFTISTNPEVANIDTTIAANQNLEIALASDLTGTAPAASAVGDAGQNTKWGNLVDLNAYFGSETWKLKPVQVALDTGVVSIPEFGLDGRISKVNTSTAVWEPLVAAPSDTTNFDDGGFAVYKDSAGTVWAIRVDYFLRTNVAGDIKLLETGTDRGDTDGTGGVGAGTTINSGSKATVAFQVTPYTGTEGSYAAGTAGALTKFYDGTATTPAWNFSDPIIASAAANTLYKVSMYIYYDGATLTNATMLTADENLKINVQFTNSAIDTTKALDVKGVNYDKVTPSTT